LFVLDGRVLLVVLVVEAEDGCLLRLWLFVLDGRVLRVVLVVVVVEAEDGCLLRLRLLVLDGRVLRVVMLEDSVFSSEVVSCESAAGLVASVPGVNTCARRSITPRSRS
jgi:hypothetical protein